MFDVYFGPVGAGMYQVGPRFVCERVGDIEEVGVPERLEDAEFWGVYRMLSDGLYRWVRDFPNQQQAVDFVRMALELRRAGGVRAEVDLLSQADAPSVFA